MCIFDKKGVHILIIPQERKRKAAKPVHPKMRTTLRPCILCSDFDLGTVLENEGYLARPVDDCFLNHHCPDGVAPLMQHHRMFFEGTDVECHFLVFLTLRSTWIL